MKASIPDDFSAIAPQHTMDELRRIYGRCGKTIRAWCKKSGVSYRKRKAINTGGKNGKISHRDPPEIVNACLTCPLPSGFCNSLCDRLKAARIAVRKRKQAESCKGKSKEGTL